MVSGGIPAARKPRTVRPSRQSIKLNRESPTKRLFPRRIARIQRPPSLRAAARDLSHVSRVLLRALGVLWLRCRDRLDWIGRDVLSRSESRHSCGSVLGAADCPIAGARHSRLLLRRSRLRAPIHSWTTSQLENQNSRSVVKARRPSPTRQISFNLPLSSPLRPSPDKHDNETNASRNPRSAAPTRVPRC